MSNLTILNVLQSISPETISVIKKCNNCRFITLNVDQVTRDRCCIAFKDEIIRIR